MSDSHGGHQHEHHLSPLSLFVKIFVALIVLTFITVGTSMYDFGIMNIVIAMGIAVLKATLVILFFMQLKFDDIGNKVAFAASFVFLSVFILLTGSDLFFRTEHRPVKAAEKAAGGGGGAPSDQNKLRVASPDLLAKGKKSYDANCVICHGPGGKGDGPAAVALTPKPRDFTSGYWKLGGSPTRVFHTISNGSPGTGMAAWIQLSIEERYALAHYVRSISPNHPDDTQEDLKVAGLLGGSAVQEKVAQEIPIDMAMDKLEVPDQVVIPAEAEINPQSHGAHLFKMECAVCHGINGVGAPVTSQGLNPPVTLMTKAFSGIQAPWVNSQGDFITLVSQGFPGRGMPGKAGFSKEEWGALHSYARELALSK